GTPAASTRAPAPSGSRRAMKTRAAGSTSLPASPTAARSPPGPHPAPPPRAPGGGPVAAGPDPAAIAVGTTAVWVVNDGDGSVTRIEPGGIGSNGIPAARPARDRRVQWWVQ